MEPAKPDQNKPQYKYQRKDKKDQEMTDESSQITEKKEYKEKPRGGDRGARRGRGDRGGRGGRGCRGGHDRKYENHVEDLKPLKLSNKERVPHESSEKGFTGKSETWFDEDRFNNKGKTNVNFDDVNKHDYYFNSYSSHHIHEEMLKDRHRTMTY